MNTVINNNPDTKPGAGGDDNTLGAIIGLIVVVVLVILMFVYLLPALRGNNDAVGGNTNPGGVDIDVSVPGQTGGSEGAGTGNQTAP